MTAEQIRELLRTTPFTPFRVHVAAEQKACEIPHPDLALLTDGGRVLVVALENVDAVHLISVPLISKIETRASAK
jgi:hypothetical protein